MQRITYQFGPFKVNSHERAVRRAGKLLPLTPKVFDILWVLIQNPGKILTKEEIVQQVWADTAVEESNLARNVSTLRRMLGEEPEQPKYIETIPWRGYRFIADVSEFREAEESIDSIAVLPFINEGQDPDTEYLSDGITESLIHQLSLIHSLKVISNHSVSQYKVLDQKVHLPDVKKIGFDLGVRAVLTGHIRLVGDSVQIGAELIDASDRCHLWGSQYNRMFTDIYSLQETISKQIVEQLKLKITGQDKQRLDKPPTENPEAFELYLRGRYLLNRVTLDNLKKGIELFKQAIELDPDYALAYNGLLGCYALLNQPAEARKAALKALELDPTLGEVHSSLGFFKFLYDWDFPGAEIEFKQAVELAPNNADAHSSYAHYLSIMGRHEEAFHEVMQARELDPITILKNGTIGGLLFLARDYDGAIDVLEHALELDPGVAATHSTLGIAYGAKGMLEEALAQLEKSRTLMGNHPMVDANTKALTGWAYAVAGRRTEAVNIIEEVSRPNAATPYNIASIYAVLEEYDRAFECLERAFQERSPELVKLKVDFSLDSLRNDPRFQDLLERVGFE